MSFDPETLYALLPAVYRSRDAQNGFVLQSLVGLLAGQIGVLEEDLAQLYDNQFIETCAPWAIPYIGESVGWKPLQGSIPGVRSPRAEVADTVALRRHKGTAAMLEVLAREVTGWPARVVEYLELLQTTQYLQHLRPGNATPDLREGDRLERLGTALEDLPHNADVRRIPPGRGRYNIPSIGIFLWRLAACPSSGTSAFAVEPGLRYTFSPLGIDTPLFTLPQELPTIDEFTKKADRLQLPMPISRRVASENLADYYGAGRSFQVEVGGQDVGVSPGKELADLVSICDLGDLLDAQGKPTGAWAHVPPQAGKVAIDPVLGRIAFPSPVTDVTVTYHYGFSAPMGGGEYDRRNSVAAWTDSGTKKVDFQRGVTTDPTKLAEASDPTGLVPTLTEALAEWNAWTAGRPGGFGVIAVMDPLSSDELLDIRIPAGFDLALVAADWPPTGDPALVRSPGVLSPNGLRPLLGGDLTVTGTGPADALNPGSFILDGFLLSGTLRVKPGPLAQVLLLHSTLVPWTSIGPDQKPIPTTEARLIVEEPHAALETRHSIVGAVRMPATGTLTMSGSILDATDETGIAFADLDAASFGGTLHLTNCTVRGRLKSTLIELLSNSIVLARLPGLDPQWPAPVLSDRRQAGCVRFSVLPPESLVPRKFHCQPDLAIAELARKLNLASVGDLDPALAAAREAELVPQFRSFRYGDPDYAQLSSHTAPGILHGAEDRAEMGAFHDLFQPQRLSNLKRRLEEYLRFGLEAGAILST